MKKSDFRSRLKDAMNIRGLKAVDLESIENKS
jgi:hypothetical protein